MILGLLSALAGVALGALGASVGTCGKVPKEEVDILIKRSAEANSALVQGEIDGYLALI